MNLKHKQVLITGGAKGIGLATAKRILNEGANVIIWDFKEDDLLQTVRDLKEQGHNVFSQICDVTNKEQVYQNAAIIKEKFGDDVIIKIFEKQKSFLAKKLSSSIENQLDNLIDNLQERSLWQKFGL